MNDRCRELCRKYTELEEGQIEVIVSYLDKLQDIADKEESNVYIDCLTFNQHSAVIVAEAIPVNVDMIYQRSLLGMVIKTYNEPAVERGFRLGVPTTGVVAIEMPTVNKIVQSVFPIVSADQVIAVLIYEKKLEHYLPKNSSINQHPKLDSSAEWVLAHLSDAVIIIDESGIIAYCNDQAKQLFKTLGYADSVQGMRSENIIPGSKTDKYQFTMSGHTLKLWKFDLFHNSSNLCVIIKDLTEVSELKKQTSMLSTEYQELAHSMKNGLYLLKNVCDRKEKKSMDKSVRQAYQDMSRRVMSLMMTMVVKLRSDEKNTDIRHVLRELGERLIDLDVRRGIDLIITGDELRLDSEATNAVVLVVYELLCNVLKHAFNDRDSGTIRIQVKKDDFVSWIMVSDDGCGFNPAKVHHKSDGLELIRTIVRERLNGNLVIESTAVGTAISFDII